MKKSKIYSVLITMVALFSIAAFLAVFFHAGYDDKILVKLGIRERKTEKNWAVFSWDSCLDKLEYDSDIVFLGDSITRGGDFQEYFSNKKVVNLGYSGDTVKGMAERVSMVKSTTPEQVFIMGGINSITNDSLDIQISEYEKLLKELRETCPKTTVYIQSVLPISKEKERNFRDNSTIDEFNEKLEKLSDEYNMQYIDLFSVFFENGELKPDLSEDGIHINSAGYEVWAQSIGQFIE